MGREAYVLAVHSLRQSIAEGTVYQANLCRILQAELPAAHDVVGLAGRLAVGNPAPHAGLLRLPGRRDRERLTGDLPAPRR